MVVGVLLLAVVVGVIYLFSVVAGQVSEIGAGATGTTAPCPTPAAVSEIIGSPLQDAGVPDELEAVPGFVGVTGCLYTAAQGADLDVTIISAPALIADEQIAEFTSEGENAGATVRPISVGDRGFAWSSEQKSAAIAVEGGRLVLVEIFTSGTGTLDDRTAAATRLLEDRLAQ
ncbi:MAG: hypothetical protein ACT4RN_09605 [Pseudonocardia sp.]